MQSSNFLFNYELDNRHGGGGIETTLIQEEESMTKRLKLASGDNIKDSDQEPSTIVNDSKISSPSHDFGKQSIQPDDIASNSTLDHLNRTWSGRRKHQKQLKRKLRTFLPDSTELITCPLFPSTDKNSTLDSNANTEFIMNPSGKSPEYILHEYLQHTLRVQPKYIFKKLESANTPYGAVVFIGNYACGTGFSSSKKLAKADAAKSALQFLTTNMKKFAPETQNREEAQDVEPDSTKLITCPLFPFTDQSSTLGNNANREFIKNINRKTFVSILQEYVQHTLRVQPKYTFKKLESVNTPYGAVVSIDDIEYGCGFGSSKKLARSDAAKSALQILIPKMKMFAPETQNGEEAQDVEEEHLHRIASLQSKACLKKPNMAILNKLKEEMLKYYEKMFFDQVCVEDPRVCDLSVKAGQPYPYQILLECLKRIYGMSDMEIEFWMTNLKHQENEFYMKVGKHQVSVICKNERDGKHRASQTVLQRLHPHIKSWGSLLRMYGEGSCKTLPEKEEKEQKLTELQSQECVNEPNIAILNKLKEEMLNYQEKMISKKPVGKPIPERMEFFSTSNLNKVEL